MQIRLDNAAVGLSTRNELDPITGMRMLLIIDTTGQEGNPNPSAATAPLSIVVPMSDELIRFLHDQSSPVQIVSGDKLNGMH